jgi:uncharacterized protein (TIGR03437 family)
VISVICRISAHRLAIQTLCGLAAVAISPQGRGEIRILAVTSSASFVPGLPAPGSLATIFCAGLTGGLEVQVTVDRFAAPVLAAADLGGYQQINFQVPWEAQSATAVGIAQGANAASFAVPLFPAWDVFFANASANAVAQHAADYTAVTADHPVRPGEWIIAYATNLGPVANQPPTGAPAPLDQISLVSPGLDSLSVLLQGEIVESNYIGLVVGTVGLYQVNLRVPDNSPGGNVELRIQKSRFCGFFFVPGCGRGLTLSFSVPVNLPVAP